MRAYVVTPSEPTGDIYHILAEVGEFNQDITLQNFMETIDLFIILLCQEYLIEIHREKLLQRLPGDRLNFFNLPR